MTSFISTTVAGAAVSGAAVLGAAVSGVLTDAVGAIVSDAVARTSFGGKLARGVEPSLTTAPTSLTTAPTSLTTAPTSLTTAPTSLTTARGVEPSLAGGGAVAGGGAPSPLALPPCRAVSGEGCAARLAVNVVTKRSEAGGERGERGGGGGASGVSMSPAIKRAAGGGGMGGGGMGGGGMGGGMGGVGGACAASKSGRGASNGLAGWADASSCMQVLRTAPRTRASNGLAGWADASS